MIEFYYRAISPEGETVENTIKATSESAAAKTLLGKGYFPIQVQTPEEKSSLAFLGNSNPLNRITLKQKVIFSRQLSTLINAGLPISDALTSASDQIDNPKLRAIVADITQNVQGGATLKQAFSAFPEAFNQAYISLIEAGESSGTLDKSLQKIANQLEKENSFQSKIRGALVYPVIVLVVVVLVVTFLLTTVVPAVGTLYRDLGRELPWVTQLLLGFSSFLKNFWYLVVIALAGGLWAARSYIKTPSGRLAWDGLKLNVPIINVLLKKIYTARFSSTLGTLAGTGVPLLEALNITAQSVNNRVIQNRMAEVISKVKGGGKVSEAITEIEYFPKLVSQMLAIGEKSGKTDEMLEKLTSIYEEEIEAAVKGIQTVIEPALIVFLGLIVAFIIGAILLPIYSLAGQGINTTGAGF